MSLRTFLIEEELPNSPTVSKQDQTLLLPPGQAQGSGREQMQPPSVTEVLSLSPVLCPGAAEPGWS